MTASPRVIWLQQHFVEVVLLGAGGGFVMLLAELLMGAHTEGIQIVAVASSILGLALVALGFFGRGALRRGAIYGLFFVAFTGLFGVFEHIEEGGGEAEAEYAEYGEYGENEEAEAVPPVLAPLSLAGVALLAGLALLVKEDATAAG